MRLRDHRIPHSCSSRAAAPSLTGETMTEARSSAQAVGVCVQPLRHRVCPHPGTPVGRVCEQTPSPGSEVPRHPAGRPVFRHTSAGNSPLGHNH
ncbi:PASTA domain-containing protein [Streptomyces sp. NPDC051896]|uniref:PASTA domain-containing protein n=1 Tax=Streptomyces sp. NPDC051896 TaxID=3155416 RepID=UPI00342C75FA